MKILAFETSCDDTAIAVVEAGVKVLANVRQTQTEHNAYGGVVPEIAARLHAENWRAVWEQCLNEANLKIEDIDAIAVTQGPGLQTSLLTGTTAASFLSLFHDKPLIPVQHILGHMASVTLDRAENDFAFPALTFTASGGHSDFYLCEDFVNVKKVGQTIDDAAGEAFDKCAKMLGLDKTNLYLETDWRKEASEKGMSPDQLFEKVVDAYVRALEGDATEAKFVPVGYGNRQIEAGSVVGGSEESESEEED